MRTSLLVVANQTVDAPELLSYLSRRAEMGTTKVTLVLPTKYAEREAARARADDAVAHLAQAGIAADAHLADEDPAVAVQEAWDPRRYDEVIVCTLPVGSSRWLACGLPHRIERLTDATVHHLEARPAREVPEPVPLPPRERPPLLVGVLGQLRASTRRAAEQ
jgi:hypothetical protein